MNQFFTTGKLTTTTGISTNKSNTMPTIELTNTSGLTIKLSIEVVV